MVGSRYVVLGLAPSKAAWLRTVAQWTQSSSIPVELVKCLSAEELRTRLCTNRQFSAILVDACLPALDRDLIDATVHAGSAVIVVEEGRSRRSWSSLGASAVLAPSFEPADLMEALRQNAPQVADSAVTDFSDFERDALMGQAPSSWRPAIVVAVCGSGGVGTSTLAMSIAQGLVDWLGSSAADGVRDDQSPFGRRVLLADFARRSDMAVLHDAGDVVPGLQELVEAHRNRQLTPAEVHPLAYAVSLRGYNLLLGLRRACDWASIRPRAFEASFASLRAAYGAVVCDIDSDFETERDGGSADVEERNVMSLTALTQSDVVIAVGLPGLKGTHGLIRLLRDLSTSGAPPERVIPVFNLAPKSGRAKGELARVLSEVIHDENPRTTSARHQGPASPIFVPERTLEEMAGHAFRLPGPVADPLAASVGAVLSRSGRRVAEPSQPRAVAPGSLGHLYEDDESASG